jgi:hypothetical protein
MPKSTLYPRQVTLGIGSQIPEVSCHIVNAPIRIGMWGSEGGHMNPKHNSRTGEVFQKYDSKYQIPF